jgi:MYXO-CTERM domain-containing protein
MRLQLGLGLATVCAACAPACTIDTPPPELGTSEAPVVGADLDTGDPGVVALVTSTGRVFCTGTLVSPQVVLSAGHCLEEAGGDPAVAAFFGNDTESVGTRIGVVMTRTHPMWNGNLAGAHDVSVSLLTTPQDPALVVPMNKMDLAPFVGSSYRVVGFGIHDRQTRELDGKKRTAMMTIDTIGGGVHPDYFEVSDVDADEASAICQGDSGGPGFISVDGVEYLAGVHSYSIQGCINPSGEARPDLYMEEFIQPFIDTMDASCRMNGVCVRAGCSADPDCLPCNADGTCTTACSLSDPDCPTSGLGEICQADTQCTTGRCINWTVDTRSRFCSQPCATDADCPVTGMVCRDVLGEGRVCDYAGEPPGALGQSCEQPTDCSAYLCVEGACTYTCDVSRSIFCPDGYACDTVDGTTYVCISETPPDEGGCCSTGGSPSAAGLLVIAALRRRRRRQP